MCIECYIKWGPIYMYIYIDYLAIAIVPSWAEWLSIPSVAGPGPFLIPMEYNNSCYIYSITFYMGWGLEQLFTAEQAAAGASSFLFLTKYVSCLESDCSFIPKPCLRVNTRPQVFHWKTQIENARYS